MNLRRTHGDQTPDDNLISWSLGIVEVKQSTISHDGSPVAVTAFVRGGDLLSQRWRGEEGSLSRQISTAHKNGLQDREEILKTKQVDIRQAVESHRGRVGNQNPDVGGDGTDIGVSNTV